MSEYGLHLVSLKDVVKRVYLEILPSHRKVIGDGIELDSMNRLFQLETFHCFVSPLIDHVESALFSSRKDVVTLAGNRIDVRLMDLFDLLAEAANPQVPDPDFPILSTRNAYLVIFEGNIFNFLVSLKDGQRPDNIRG